MRKLFYSGFWNVQTLWIMENTRTWAPEMALQWQEVGLCSAHQGMRREEGMQLQQKLTFQKETTVSLTWHIMCLTRSVSPITVGSTTYIVRNADGFLPRMQQAQAVMLRITNIINSIPMNAIIFKSMPYYLKL